MFKAAQFRENDTIMV